jgi:type VI secretion system secreted protein Hcp
MALNAYLKLVASRQGHVLGSVSQKGREGTIMVVAVSQIRSAEIDFYRPDRTGIERKYFKIQLTNANISGMRLWVPNTRNPRSAQFPEREEIAFTYQKISWTWLEGAISAEDDWLLAR